MTKTHKSAARSDQAWVEELPEAKGEPEENFRPGFKKREPPAPSTVIVFPALTKWKSRCFCCENMIARGRGIGWARRGTKKVANAHVECAPLLHFLALRRIHRHQRARAK